MIDTTQLILIMCLACSLAYIAWIHKKSIQQFLGSLNKFGYRNKNVDSISDDSDSYHRYAKKSVRKPSLSDNISVESESVQLDELSFLKSNMETNKDE